MRHLLRHRAAVERRLRKKEIMLFLDYDGTLAPIAGSPKEASMPRETRGLIEQLSNTAGVGLSIVSGRALRDVAGMVGVSNIIYAGNHGLELKGPKISFRSPIPASYMETLRRIKENLSRDISRINGALLEDKGMSLCLHYRRVKRQMIPDLKTIFRKAVILHSVRGAVKIREGKMALEVRPPVEWDKGKAVLWLWGRRKYIASGKDVIPVYIGDDATDEDAFRALRGKGVTVRVGKSDSSRARYYLRDTAEVAHFLRRLLVLKRGDVRTS